MYSILFYFLKQNDFVLQNIFQCLQVTMVIRMSHIDYRKVKHIHLNFKKI